MRVVSAVLTISCATVARSAVDRPKVAILVDPFTEYLSGRCKEYCEVENVRAIDIVSPYTASFLESKGMNLPPFLLAPPDGSEMNWATDRGIDVENENICVIAESDAGVPTAERIASSLNLRGNGISPQLRNKFLSNERVKSFGMKAVKQVLAHDWKEAGSFLEDELWFDIDSANRFCVVKPYRGVASDGVFLCRGFEEARKAFKALHKKPQFGGGINEAVLVQEYVSGQEYAVDTVAMDGDIKVVALWRYKKLPANGAPFVYQCTELCSMITDEGRLVCEYCIGALKAQGLKWGPTHTEIMATADGPRLIEINARFHAQHFQPIVSECIGYDAMTATLDSYFKPDEFTKLPRIPADASGYGLILHLISSKEGVIARINHEEAIRGLPSFKLLHLESEVGGQLAKTVDIRTDCGYVVLISDDPAQLARDFDHIVSLQSSLFEVVGDRSALLSECEPGDDEGPPVIGEQPSMPAAETETETETVSTEKEGQEPLHSPSVESQNVGHERLVRSSEGDAVPSKRNLFADSVSVMQGGASSGSSGRKAAGNTSSNENDEEDDEGDDDEDDDDEEEEEEEEEDDDGENDDEVGVELRDKKVESFAADSGKDVGNDGGDDDDATNKEGENESADLGEVIIEPNGEEDVVIQQEVGELQSDLSNTNMSQLATTETEQRVESDDDVRAYLKPEDNNNHQYQEVEIEDIAHGDDKASLATAEAAATEAAAAAGLYVGQSQPTIIPQSSVIDVDSNAVHSPQQQIRSHPTAEELKTLSEVYAPRSSPLTAADMGAFRDKLWTRLSGVLASVRERALSVQARYPQYIVPASRLAIRACLVLAAYLVAAYGSAILVPIVSEFM